MSALCLISCISNSMFWSNILQLFWKELRKSFSVILVHEKVEKRIHNKGRTYTTLSTSAESEKLNIRKMDPTTIKMKKLAEITRNILKSCDFDSSILFLILSPAEVSRNWSIVSRDARSNFWLLLTFKKIAE